MLENLEKNDFKPGNMNREELIQAYWRNKLDKAEKAEFDRLFKTDSEFRKEVEFHQDMSNAFSAMEREHLKNKLQEFESELKAPKQKSYALWLAAASVVLIVGVSLMTFFNTTADPGQLYADYFKPYENVVVPITRGESIESMKKEVFIAYEKEAYQKAATGFRQLYENTQEPYYLLYQANALMGADQVEKAVPVLREHMGHEDRFLEKSRWYLALAYLKIKETEKAKAVLRQIQQNHSYNSAEATRILKALE